MDLVGLEFVIRMFKSEVDFSLTGYKVHIQQLQLQVLRVVQLHSAVMGKEQELCSFGSGSVYRTAIFHTPLHGLTIRTYTTIYPHPKMRPSFTRQLSFSQWHILDLFTERPPVVRLQLCILNTFLTPILM